MRYESEEISYNDIEKIKTLINKIDPEHKVFSNTENICKWSRKMKETKDMDLLKELYQEIDKEEHIKNK